MTYKELIKYYGTEANAASKLGKHSTQIYGWKYAGEIPKTAQFEIQVKSNGDLLVDEKYMKED